MNMRTLHFASITLLALLATSRSVTAQVIQSDDFNTYCNLPPALWTYVDPLGDGSIAFVGAGTSNAQLLLSVPAGNSHDVWRDGNDAPRLMQAAADTDFEIEVKFESALLKQFQMQGLIVEQSAQSYLRFDFFSDGSRTNVFAAFLNNGSATTKVYKGIASGVPLSMRVQRVGQTWTQKYSYDGLTWTTAVTFTQALTVTQVGVFAGNFHNNEALAPAHTAIVDYFFNTASPIVPEDGGDPDSGGPFTLTVERSGSGNVQIDPEQPTYDCSDVVTLTAVPDPGFSFFAWSGDVAGTANPLVVNMTADRHLLATFVPGSVPPAITNVHIDPTDRTATITWLTDQPATSHVDYGRTLAYEDGFVDDPSLVTAHTVVLTNLSPSTLYHCQITSTNDDGQSTRTSDLTFTTDQPPGSHPSGIDSDDFDVACNQLSSFWSFVNPIGDGSYSITGVGTQNARLEINVPAGTGHDAWRQGNFAPRVMQPANNTDFEIEAKFESSLTKGYQGQGICVQQALTHYLRFDFYSDGSNVNVFAAVLNNGNPTVFVNRSITGTNPMYLRVTRVGNTWTERYSSDGVNWTTAGSFNYTLTVGSVGVYALNAGSNPAHTALVDYFFNTATPILPEDGQIRGDGDPKTLTITVIGSGTVSKNPDQPTYSCGQVVTLTALPSSGSSFSSWGGDLSGNANPTTITMSSNKSVTATFVVDNTPPVLSNIQAVPTINSALITWNTNEPATSVVAYGQTPSYELGTVSDPALVLNHAITLSNLAPATTYHFKVTSTDAGGLSTSSSDLTFRTDSPGGHPSGIDSDDFDRLNLNTNVWTFVNPLGDAALKVVGAGTSAARLTISLDAGPSHDLWKTPKVAPRIMQPANNTDFELEVKFESPLTQGYQMQGLIIDQDDDDYLRFDLHNNGSGLRIFAATFVAGSPNIRLNQGIASGSPLWLRVTRTGNQWTERYSYNGTSWTTAVTFSHTVQVSAVGAFCGNYSSGTAPAHTAVMDYFFNTATPIVPEDGTQAPDTLPPLVHRVRGPVGKTALMLNWVTDEPSDSVVRYGLTPGYELGQIQDSEPTSDHLLAVQDLDPGTHYYVQVRSSDALGQSGQKALELTTAPDPNPVAPNITVWYGYDQLFGMLGLPQPWINVVGNVTDSDGVASLNYTLNGSAPRSLSMGPDTRRLAKLGDFNIELDHNELKNGTNVVLINAVDTKGNAATDLMFVEWQGGNVWPLPYSVNWGTTAEIGDVAQIVDGLWKLEGSTVRPVVLAYDRLIAMGDLTWTNYEVTVPITIHGFDPGGFLPPSGRPAVGMLLRWPGHNGSGNPRSGYLPLGAIGFYRIDSQGNNELQIYGNGYYMDTKLRTLANEVRYIFKMRVETVPGVGGLYRFKVWQDGTTEPPNWDLSGQATLGDPQKGSVLLISHHVDASFGAVTITPLGQ